MPELVVVAGATGYVGRHLVTALAERGYRVRAIVRSRARAEAPGPFGAPSLSGHVAEWREGDITDPGFVAGVCAGADRVCSALGVTRQRASPWDVDYSANLRLLQDAEANAIRSFLFLNAMHAETGRSLILRSKAAFARALARSPVPHQIINPSGYFSDVEAFVSMARSGVILLPPAEGARIAPIHGADLASFCADRLGGASGSWDVGGPDVLAHRDIARLAADAVGKRCRMLVVPMPVATASVWAAKRFGARPGNVAEFLVDALTRDAVGERHGIHHLDAHFRHMARLNASRSAGSSSG